MIVLDTNVVSELMRPTPSAEVVRWVVAQPSTLLCTTAITKAEMLLGAQILADGKQKKELQKHLNGLFDEDFRDHVLPFDAACANYFAEIAANRRALGRPISQPDAQIAAIVRSKRAQLATRNTADFADCGLRLIDPWNSEP